ncbi:S1C family serine protease [Aquipuribacter nitratireducens]|uniref:S1C family serine protease n=1 Tax=Aquipuribacter nitratireducens TaxID=650104 RepID=A0ABW0GNQ6_9MICO
MTSPTLERPAPPTAFSAAPTALPGSSRRRRPGRWIAGTTAAVLVTGTAVGAAALGLSAGDDLAATVQARLDGAVVEQAASGGPDSGGEAQSAASGVLDLLDPASGVDWGAVAEQVSPGVVAIAVRAADGTGGEGSGVVYDGSGLVLTNNHVIASARGGEVQVTLADGRVLTGTVLGADPSTDLAVVQLQDPPADLTVVPLGKSADVAVGDPVMAVGNPLGLSGTVTTGIVSALDRPVTTQAAGVADGQPVVTDAIQTDAAVNPGNSGGPLIDAAGRVVGINSSIATTGPQSGSVGLGFAIPVDVARDVAAQLVEDGTVEHARLGAYLQDATATVDGDGEWAGSRLGAGLAEIVPGSAAEAAGLRAGDVVVAVDGRPTTGAEALTARVRALGAGDTVPVVVARDGEAVEVDVTLGSLDAGS